MAIYFEMLGSGSSGNCGLMKISGSVFLIDVGFSCKKIKEMLSARCVDIESVLFYPSKVKKYKSIIRNIIQKKVIYLINN